MFTLACVGLIFFVWLEFGGTVPLAPSGYDVHIQFTNGANLTTNEDVRIAGVTVGKVVQVTPTENGDSAVLRIDPQYAPLPRDTHAILRFKTLVGENFVALSTGSRTGPKIPDGGSIPTANVTPIQQIDQVLGMFNAKTRASLAQFLEDSARASSGEGEALNTALGEANPASSELQQVIDIVNGQARNVQRLVSSTATAFSAIGNRATATQTLISSGDALLTATD
ncbi:MAG TPA: MlaD family protein, partial [Solirubrobacteraceae bacterium]|nr:MlaD family protein [Solirubrobacteraceae bacterium]